MPTNLIRPLTLMTSVLLVGLSAGFFSYEASVTLGLAEVDDVTYVNTFQAINSTIRNGWFAVVFFGPIPALIASLLAHRNSAARPLIGAALVLYLVGFGITMGGNVPLNEALADYGRATAETAGLARADFESDWNRLDLYRTTAFIASFGLVVLSTLFVPNRTGQLVPNWTARLAPTGTAVAEPLQSS